MYPVKSHLTMKRMGLLVLGISTFVLSPDSQPCGWWGETVDEPIIEELTISGHEINPPAETGTADPPLSDTRQANFLRTFGLSGYAGALRLYKKAALAGFAPAQNNLGAMYQEGLGVAADLIEAARWYRAAAEQNESHAQHSLGRLLIDGHGIEQDIAEGIYWISAAASQGHASACVDLGEFYRQGTHVRKNPAKAEYWRRQAREYGYKEDDNLTRFSETPETVGVQ